MNKILFEVLKRLSAFAISIGIYQFFKAQHVFDSLDGGMKFLPLAVMMILLSQIFQRAFIFERKSHMGILVAVFVVGVGLASFFS